MSTSGSYRVGDSARIQGWVRFWRWMLALVLVAGCGSDGGTDPPVDPGDRREHLGSAAAPAQVAPPELRAAYIAAVQAGASEAYRVERTEGGWTASNPFQGFTAELT